MIKRFLLFKIIIIAAFITHAQIPTSGLVAFYPFNGNANNSVSNNHNGIVNGPTLTADRFGQPNKAYQFDGLDDFIEVPHSPELEPEQELTVNAWVSVKDWYITSAGYFPILEKSNSSIGGLYNLHLSNVNGVAFSYDLNYLDKLIPFSFNEWVMISGVSRNGVLKIYCNGKELYDTRGFARTEVVRNLPLIIGRDQPGLDEYANGKIDDIRIYNRALTDTEISNIYNAEKPPIDIKSGMVAYYPFNGNANDESGNSKNGNINGGTFTTDRYNSAGKAMHFNGIDNHVDLNHSFGPFTEVSISAWVKTESGGNEIQAVLSSIGNEAFHFQLSDNGAYNIAVYTNNQSGLYPVLLPVLSNSPNNQWRHICATFKSGENKIFVNGALVSSSTHNFNFIESTSLLKIAAGWESERFFKGDIDDVKIYNRALSSSEISALFDNYIPAVATPPQITLSAASISTGETTTISGSGFTPNKQAEINIAGEGSYSFSQLVDVDANGTFNFPYTAAASYGAGFNSVTATNIVSNYTVIPSRTFYINKSDIFRNYLSIQTPNSVPQYFVNKLIPINWSDKLFTLFNDRAYGSCTYKIEVSQDGGTWKEIYSVLKDGILDKKISFNYSLFEASTPGNYQIRISNKFDPSYTVTSQVFSVLAEPAVNFNYSLEWDKSNDIVTSKEINGIAADGVARFYFKISKKQNAAPITNVQIELSDPEAKDADYKLLGKLLAVSDLNKTQAYSTEANSTKKIIANMTSALSDGGYWFWYVAPDDFNRVIPDDKYKGNRIVKATITVTYQGISQPDEIIKDINVVRPPLLLVHGLGGSESTWDDTRFENEYLDKTNLIVASDIFQADIQINQLYPAAAFEDNANLLLGKTALPLASDPNPNRNSFQNSLKNCKELKGIAANRVDYVCHSMGGCILRFAINKFPESYKPRFVGKGFANYDSGFVNKLITINTPHNGSPGADLITDVAPEFNWFEKSIIDSWFTKEASPFIFRRNISSSIAQYINYGPGSNTMPNVITYDYEATPAVKNMRYFKTDIKTGEGVRFKKTTIKNNLIAGQAAPTYQLGVDFIQDMVKELKGYKAPLAKLITRILDYKYGSKNFGKAIILSVPQIAHDFVNSIMEENYGVSSFIQ